MIDTSVRSPARHARRVKRCEDNPNLKVANATTLGNARRGPAVSPWEISLNAKSG